MRKAVYFGCGFFLFAMLLFDGFMPESMALWSRTSHKSRQTLASYQITVPFGWEISESHDSLHLLKVRGQIRSYLFGSSGEDIGFYVVPPGKNAIDYKEVVASLSHRAHENIRNIEEHRMAGKKMVCIQSSWPEYPWILNVICVPDGSMDGMSASYSGDAAHIPEFFAILDEVKKTN